MFSGILKHMDEWQLSQSELKQPHSLDEKGHIVSLGSWIDQEAPADVKAALGRAEKPAPSTHVRSVAELNNESLKCLTIEMLKQADPSESLAIVGVGDYSKDELITEVRKDSSVGERMTHVVRQHSLFIEHAVKFGKVRHQAESKIPMLPDFDF